MIASFREWFEARLSMLEQAGISLDISPPTDETITSIIHADLRSPRCEWTMQLWKSGLSDSHFLDWHDMDQGVKTTHYEFSSEGEMLGALEIDLNRMQRLSIEDHHKGDQFAYCLPDRSEAVSVTTSYRRLTSA